MQGKKNLHNNRFRKQFRKRLQQKYSFIVYLVHYLNVAL